MTDVQLGRILRAVRRRRRLSQRQLAAAVPASQTTISRTERGHLDRLSLLTLRAVFGALEIRLEAAASGRGVDLERLLDEEHALVLGRVVTLLERRAWEVAVEVTYSHSGERGSIDILASHPATSTTLVVEVKTQLVSVDATLRRLDEKARLAGGIAAERFGRRSPVVARILVLPERATERRRMARHRSVLTRALPVQDGRLVRRWLASPDGAVSAIWFLSTSHRRTQGRIHRGQSGPPGIRGTASRRCRSLSPAMTH